MRVPAAQRPAAVADAASAGLRIEGMQATLRDGDRLFRLEVERLHVAPGRMLALTGASGSGKTLLLEMLGLLRRPDRVARHVWRSADGAVTELGGLWAAGARSPALSAARAGLFGFVPQSGGLLPFLDVRANVALPQQLAGREDQRWCVELLERLALSDVARLLPTALSIGQRQRAAIARALAHRPPFVIADEPTAALDPEAADTALGLLLETASAGGTGVLLSSHDLDRVTRLGIPQARLEAAPLRDGAAEGVVSRLRGSPC